jgi:hypothetical protein
MAVNATVNVGGYCAGVRQFVQQIVYDADTTCGLCTNPLGPVPCPISLGGDSGSPVIKRDRRKVVGLNFAGNQDGSLGIGNTVQNVLSELGGLTLDLRACGVFSPEETLEDDD